MADMTFASLFAGIGGLDIGLEAAGLVPLWSCEIDTDARRVLSQHWPGVPCHEDVQTLDPATLPVPDLLCAGVPCQDWSVAGKRAGLAGERSGLFFHFVRLADALRPRWLLFENVPGLLSACSCPECAIQRERKQRTDPAHRGRDFATVLEALTGYRPEVPRKGWRNAGFGYGPKRGVAWRVLDAQFVGGCPLHVQERGIGPVPQRRRRVFVVAHTGDVGGLERPMSERHLSGLARLPVQVLFESPGCERHPAASRKKRASVAAALRSRSDSVGVHPPGRGGEDDSNLVTGSLDTNTGHVDDNTAQANHLIVGALQAHSKRHGHAMGTQQASESGHLIAHTLRSEGADAGEDGTGRGTPLVAYQCHGNNVGPMGTVRAGNGGLTGGVPFIVNAAESTARESHARESDTARCLDTSGSFMPNQGGTVIAFQERGRDGGRTLETQEDVAYALLAPAGGGRRQENNIQTGMTVRRLTPIECLRLMGLADDYLDLDPPLSDSCRYRLIGNAVVRQVAKWLGTRLCTVEDSP